ncbi:S41 family peptidase [Flagellimonas zhangzhouensis]|uniref:Peptidase family S41 n=1 Tax=Flagellimonas zhangzhouensis TaxID=1073328 RepID=A0A1H2RS23_9FLAO|nr:S41 family peptidase [Allomuricauda zhangzhouensis]SDQ66943.1 Peptidase family S41 [Allomuricauda zhangzhouensis]SDW21940.1 Peptidase family S41 [Allomuricauda zhangzhouensis]
MFKPTITLLLLLTTFLNAQNKSCNCQDELENVAKLITNAESFKVQIKKTGKEADFKAWKTKIATEIENDPLKNYFCVGYLQKFASFIKDRHNEIYLVPDEVSKSIPKYQKSFDTRFVQNDGVSGIYHMGSDKIYVNKETDGVWYGITLASNSENWTKGTIRLKIQQTSEGNYELFEFYQNGMLFYQDNVKIQNGRIHGTFWNTANQYFFNKNHKNNFNYVSLSPSFDYIGIKTLRRTRNLMKEAENFYDTNLPKLTHKNLIIDLRNNGGGATKQADELLKSLKKNKNIEKIYVLINFKTGSSAELTALALKKDPRTIIAGENSRGMLAYGYGNKSYSAETDCAGVQLSLSTEQAGENFDTYEIKGITPDIALDNQSDWVEQVMRLQ